MEIELILGQGCCIECAAKQEYNRQVMRIMTSDDPPGPEDEAKLDLLVDFLENADFGVLRSSSDSLAGIKHALCLLSRNADGNPYVTIIEQ